VAVTDPLRWKDVSMGLRLDRLKTLVAKGAPVETVALGD
jgi:hypothetical protein